MVFKTQVTSFSEHYHRGLVDGRVRYLTIHPTLPWVATVTEGSFAKSGGPLGEGSVVASSRISSSNTFYVTIWDHDKGERLLEWSDADLFESMKRYEYGRVAKQMHAQARQHILQNKNKGLLNRDLLHSSNIRSAASAAVDKMFGTEVSPNLQMGQILQVKFLDRHTLYWEGQHCALQKDDHGYPPTPQTSGCHEPHLIVVFQKITIILPMRNFSGAKKSLRIYSTISSEDMRAFSSNSTNQESSSTSPKVYPISVQPISIDLMLVGCSDGTIQFFNVSEHKAIRRIKAHQTSSNDGNSSGEAVIRIIPAVSLAQIYETERTAFQVHNAQQNYQQAGSFLIFTDASSPNTISRSSLNTSHYRFVTLGTSGLAYLWNLTCSYKTTTRIKTTDIENSTSQQLSLLRHGLSCETVTISLTKIKRPMAKIELLNFGSNVTVSEDLVHYDMERDLFLAPLGTIKSSSLGIWDLSAIPTSVQSVSYLGNAAASQASSNSGGTSTTDKQQQWYQRHSTTPLIEPYIQLFLPSSLFTDSSVGGSASNISSASLTSSSSASSSSINLLQTILCPTKHQAFTNESTMPVWIIHKSTGDAALLAVSLLYTGDPKVKVRPEVHHHIHLNELRISSPRSDPNSQQIQSRIHAVRIPKSNGHNLIIGSDVGSIVTETIQVPKILTGSRHIAISDTSVLFVEGPSVFVATLSPSRQTPPRVGPIAIINPALVHKSIPPGSSVDAASDATHGKLRLPPKMLLSPSGSFVCLFWVSDFQYEILHIKSLLGTFKINGLRAPPLVEFGVGIKSFAWVGEDDIFALIRTPASVLAAAAAVSAKQAQSSSSRGFTFAKRKLSINKQSPADTSELLGVDSEGIPTEGAVAMRILLPVNVAAAITSCAAATGRGIGNLPLRGGQPLQLFGGPVLCVAATQPGRLELSNNGMAYFYAKKASEIELAPSELKASSFTPVGTNLPLPDLVEWSEDGRYCCVCIGSRIIIYISGEAGFAVLGTTNIEKRGINYAVESATFLNGVLFCGSRHSLHAIFPGTINETFGGVTPVDSLELATMDISICQRSHPTDANLGQVPYSMQLETPTVLMYLNGSLVVSTAHGIQLVPIDHPFLRIGALLAAGHIQRAKEWFDAIPRSGLVTLANFLERRGFPEVALSIPGLHIYMVVDLSIRWRRTNILEEIIDEYGLDSIRQINMGDSTSYSAVECVGAVLLAEGKAEVVRRLASESVMTGDEVRREGFVLASLLLAVDPKDATRLLKRAVGTKGKLPEEKCWPVVNYFRSYVFN